MNYLRTVRKTDMSMGKDWETIMEKINSLTLLSKHLTWDAKPNWVRNVGECGQP